MRILFLDMDGVIVPFNISVEDDNSENVYYHKNQLKRVLKETGALLVISSAWRRVYGKTFFELVFGKNNIHDDWRTVDTLSGAEAEKLSGLKRRPKFSEDGRTYPFRGCEIQEWLNRHPEVENYAIVDDYNEFLPEQQLHYVHTDHYDALTEDKADDLIRILNAGD